mgnify:CR=1 FL=1|tara:strand:+ start:588 stop:1535 length:948 start_codon:yes stop_codon:yes gene_type:complete
MLPTSLATSLQTAADLAISKVLANGGKHTCRPSGEVSAVRAITLDGFDEVAVHWSPILSSLGYSIDLKAVFCHSRPHVTFQPVPHPKYQGGMTPRRCELADMLIVIDHVDPIRKIDDRRAVLVQAKLLKGGRVKPSGKEWIQHELLGWLPKFTFVDTSYDQRTRDFKGKPLVGSPAHTAEYGGIDLNVSSPVWQQEMVQKTPPWFGLPIPLSGFLAFMATGNMNCSRHAIHGGRDDWSFTVDELLRITATRPITKKKSIQLRGNHNVVGFLADTSQLFGSGGGGDYIEGDVPEWPEGPISTVHMTFRSIDSRAEK